MLFISPQKLFSFSRYLTFGHVAKRIDKKDKVNFKFYDVTAWLTKNIVIEKLRQSDNEIWSVNRMQQEKHFYWKIIHKM